MKINAFVHEEGDKKNPIIRVGNLLTIEIEISLPNALKVTDRGHIHSNAFPYMRKDNFVILITSANGSKVLNIERIFFRTGTHTWKMAFRPEAAAKMQFIVHLKNDAYKGLDCK